MTSGEADIIDQSPMAAVVLQADSPVFPPALSVQLRVHPRDEARLLLGPQGHITEVSPAAQAVGAAGPSGGVEGVEIAASAAPYAQQLEAGQHGRRPSAPPAALQEPIGSSIAWAGARSHFSVWCRRELGCVQFQPGALLGQCKPGGVQAAEAGDAKLAAKSSANRSLGTPNKADLNLASRLPSGGVNQKKELPANTRALALQAPAPFRIYPRGAVLERAPLQATPVRAAAAVLSGSSAGLRARTAV